MLEADAVVVGGGPAGSAAGLRLAAAGRSVVIVERAGAGGSRPEPGAGEILPGRVRLVLEELGVWLRFVDQSHLPSPGMVSFWGRAQATASESVFDPYGDAWHVDRPCFDDMLLDAAEQAGVRVHRGAEISRLCRHGDGGWCVEVTGSGRDRDVVQVRAPWLVEATGRRLAGSPTPQGRVVADHLLGVVGVVATGRAQTDRRALLEATPQGWWYVAPLTGDRLVLAFMADAGTVRAQHGNLARLWQAALRNAGAVRERLGACDPAGVPLRVVSASTYLRRHLAGDGWVAAGDNVSAHDPLCGQGVCWALQGGMMAADAVVGADTGDRSALPGYARQCTAAFDSFLDTRRDLYRRELRWPDSPFWRRRQA